MDLQLAGKVGIVTGASRGIGRAIAETLAAEGTPLDDHRASAAYRAAMLGQSLLKFYDESQNLARQGTTGTTGTTGAHR